MQVLEPTHISRTHSRDVQEGTGDRRQGRLSGISQTYPRQSSHPHSPHSVQCNSQHHQPPSPPPLPHPNTQLILSANLLANRPTQRARSHSRATIEESQRLTGLTDNSLVAAQAYGAIPGMLDLNAPEFTWRTSPKRDTGLPDGATDNHSSRGNRTSQRSSVSGNAEAFVLEVVVLDKDSRGEGAERSKPQRGSVKKLTDTLENVARKSPSPSSLKRSSGPPRLGSPFPSPGLPQSFTQQ